jgi:hypothetical protein
MSVVVMILAAAMAVPASGPETMSGEMERGLDLRGEWEGLWWKGDGNLYWVRFHRWGTEKDSCTAISYVYDNRHNVQTVRFEVVDKGNGELRVTFGSAENLSGSYRQEGSRVVICLPDEGEKRELFVLRPAKARKEPRAKRNYRFNRHNRKFLAGRICNPSCQIISSRRGETSRPSRPVPSCAPPAPERPARTARAAGP